MVSTLLITARHRHHDGEVERRPARIAIADGPAVVGLVSAGLRLVRDRHAPMCEASTTHQARPTRPPISPTQHTLGRPYQAQGRPKSRPQPRPIGGYALTGRPYRPSFSHRLALGHGREGCGSGHAPGSDHLGCAVQSGHRVRFWSLCPPGPQLESKYT